MRDLVEALCSEECAGRAPGIPGGREGRRIIAAALAAHGLAVDEQPVPDCGGANLLATIPAAGASVDTTERWVLLGAHHDHLGRHGSETFWGAEDNAAAVAILVEAAGALARDPPARRGVILAFFDGEEPPHFLADGMGSEWYAARPTVPLDRIDAMLCMDLVGHAIGGPHFPAEVRGTVFALGAERGAGTAAHLDALANAEPGVWIRRLDAEIVPPLSDDSAFWSAGVPFVFLTCGRWQHYHTPNDTPEKLDYPKMAALARWLQRWTRDTCAPSGAPNTLRQRARRCRQRAHPDCTDPGVGTDRATGIRWPAYGRGVAGHVRRAWAVGGGGPAGPPGPPARAGVRARVTACPLRS